MRRGRQRIFQWAVFLLLLGLLASCADEPAEQSTPVDSTNPEPTATPASDAPAEAVAAGEAPATTESTPMPSETPTVTPTPPPSATPTATRPPTGPLTVCLGQEPLSLYLYGPDSYAADVVREVVYDGPIDTRGFEMQPVILEKIPSVADGDAAVETVTVAPGDWVVDADGNVVRLRPGVVVRPAGCREDSCLVTFGQSEEGVEAGATETPSDEEEVTATPPPPIEMEQLTADFSLRQDILWSDGEALTAADSVFSFQVAQEAVLPPRQRTGRQGVVPERTIDPVARTASYEAVDEFTVRWTGLPGYMDPYYQGNFFTPLPEHQLGDYTPEELLQAEEAARLPLGWGPYVLQEWVAGEQIVADRNPAYFRAGEQLPYYDQIIFRFPQGDPAAFLDELDSGECDVITQDALNADYGVYQDLQDQGTLTFYAVPGLVLEHLDVGINPIPDYDWRGDFFEDARVRRALAYCVNRDALAEELMLGRSVVPDAYLSPLHPLYEMADLTNYAYDPAAGVALLEEAGWIDTNGDGVAEAYGIAGLQDGTTLVFNYTSTTSEMRQRTMERVIQDLAACNVRVYETEPVAGEVYFTPGLNSPVFGRQFDITNFAWLSGMEPPCHLFLSSQIPGLRNNWDGFNVAGYENPVYDAACNAAQSSVPGMDSYQENHLEALRIFNDEMPMIPLFFHLRTALSRPDLDGMNLDPTAGTELWNVEGLRPATE